MNIKSIPFVLIVLLFNAVHTSEMDDYPEITSEEIADAEVAYVNHNEVDQKKYLEPVIKPHKFDLNKDRKISKEELKEAILYVIYPKDEKKAKNINEEVKIYLKNNVDLFVSSVKLDFLNFKQFSHMMNKISLTNFFDTEVIRSRLQAIKDNVSEGEGDL